MTIPDATIESVAAGIDALQQDQSRRNAEDHIENMAVAFRKVLSEGAPGGEAERVILIKRIPIVCNDIMVMKADIGTIKTIGMYLLLGVGSLFLTVIGAILIKAMG